MASKQVALGATTGRRWLDLGLMAGWIILGTGLRFTNLTAKPLWTDEFSTIVFSLGNSFRTVPLDRVISMAELLQPLQPNPQAGVGTVMHHLLTESNHPPLYFVLTHLWLQLFPPVQGLVSIWAVRSLSAGFGVLSIPATFGLAWWAFRSRVTAHLAAALMATSPFGVYLAQEARHYTLPILWAIASLGCLVIALRLLHQNLALPRWLCGSWILVNGLGIATHYFFTLVLASAGLVLLVLGSRDWQKLRLIGWQRLGLVVIGSVVSGLVWLPFLSGASDNELTRWIVRSDRQGWQWLDPIAQTLAGWITMLYMLPIQAGDRPVVMVSIVALLLLSLGTAVLLGRGWSAQWKIEQNRLPLDNLGGFVVGAIALFLGITYGLERDVTSAFRYNFVYFPAVVVLMGGALAHYWQQRGKWIVMLIIGLSCVGAVTVVTNLGYQKTHRPDLVVQAIQAESHGNVLVAIAHRTHGQTGRLMGLAHDWQRHPSPTATVQFLLAHQTPNPQTALTSLQRALETQPRPFGLWLINVETVAPKPLRQLLSRQACTTRADSRSVDGYRYQPYACAPY